MIKLIIGHDSSLMINISLDRRHTEMVSEETCDHVAAANLNAVHLKHRQAPERVASLQMGCKAKISKKRY